MAETTLLTHARIEAAMKKTIGGELSMRGFGLETISRQVLHLGSLRCLDLSWNMLKSTDGVLMGLTHLKMLDLSHNAFVELPSEIFDLRTQKGH